MNHDYYPTFPYSESEKTRILRDLHTSHQIAVEQHDVARSFYTEELIKENDDN